MDQLFVFLKEYIEFFEKMEQTQQEKLALLLSKELKKIEQSIMMQQAMDKQLENMEKRRAVLFADLGYEGKTFRQIIDLNGEDGAGRQECQTLYDRLNRAMDNISFYNNKAQELAKGELARMGADLGNVDPSSGIYRPDYGGRKNFFEKKI